MFQKPLLCLVALFVFSTSFCRAEVDENNDFQFWFYQNTETTLDCKWTFDILTELRFGDSASVLFQYFVQCRFNYKINKHLVISPGYRQQWNLEDNRWRKRYQPLVDFTANWELNKWKFYDRNRFTYIIPEDGLTALEYRNRILLKSPWKFGRFAFNPTIFEELFFRERRGFSQNRFGVGGSFPLGGKSIQGEETKHTGALFFMLREQQGGDRIWLHHNVLWLWLNFFF